MFGSGNVVRAIKHRLWGLHLLVDCYSQKTVSGILNVLAVSGNRAVYDHLATPPKSANGLEPGIIFIFILFVYFKTFRRFFKAF